MLPASTANPVADSAIAASHAPFPTLRRRYLCMTYEAMLLFGVVFVAELIFDIATQSRSALKFREARAVWQFLVVGLYFTWFWTHGGQTLAMKTWRIRLIEADARPVSPARAALRYVLCWTFVLPTLAMLGAIGFQGHEILGSTALAAAFLIPPLWMLIDRDRQFIHDRILGTRLVAIASTS
jgi:uncharacterized RDD family membrane protein YckC